MAADELVEIMEIIGRLDRQNYLMEKRYEILKSMICDIYDEIISQKKVCPICKSEIRCYIPYGKPMRYHAQCPVCLGAERERLLARYLDLYWGSKIAHNVDREGGKVKLLHFAPELGFHQRFHNMEEVDYYPVDINADYPYHIVQTVDITNIPYPDDYFDLVICFHVMQYVGDEKTALEEVRRVLKHKGTAIFCDNINSDLTKILEKTEYNTPELREEKYGNRQYVRRYGTDYAKRLGEVWGKDHITTYSVNELDPKEVEKYYLLRGEELCIYKK